MVSARKINQYAAEVARRFNPERVILFGSYAHGNPTKDSDVDLLVIMNHDGRNVDQAVKICERLDRTFPIDLLVKTPAEIRRRLKLKDVFLGSILNEGRILYERSRR